MTSGKTGGKVRVFVTSVRRKHRRDGIRIQSADDNGGVGERSTNAVIHGAVQCGSARIRKREQGDYSGSGHGGKRDREQWRVGSG